MTLQEQAWQSGLVFSDDMDNNSDVPQWNFNVWPPILGGWRYSHASVVLDHQEQDDSAQTVVVLGGANHRILFTDSVLLLSLSDENKQWREGPPLSDKRGLHAAVVCNGGVYVIGGSIGNSRLDTIERIDIEELLQTYSTSTTGNHWTTLNCRLSTPKTACSAVAVYNRYIVVIGGTGDGNCLSSVDIIDTKVQSNHAVIVGPSMTIPREEFGSAVIGHRIYVVGGCNRNDDQYLTSVEYLEFQQSSAIETTETAAEVFPPSCAWTTLADMKLSAPRQTRVVSLGSCLVAVGGCAGTGDAEVLDINRNIVWTLPKMPALFNVDSSTVTFWNGIAVMTAFWCKTCATLPLMDKNTWCFRRLCHQEPNGWYPRGFQELPDTVALAPGRAKTNSCNDITNEN